LRRGRSLLWSRGPNRDPGLCRATINTFTVLSNDAFSTTDEVECLQRPVVFGNTWVLPPGLSGKDWCVPLHSTSPLLPRFGLLFVKRSGGVICYPYGPTLFSWRAPPLLRLTRLPGFTAGHLITHHGAGLCLSHLVRCLRASSPPSVSATSVLQRKRPAGFQTVRIQTTGTRSGPHPR